MLELLYLFKIVLDHPIHPPRTETNPWDCQMLEDCGYKVKISQGVFQVFKDEADLEAEKHIEFDVPNLETFVKDMQNLCAMIADGPLKSFCYRRLSYLQSRLIHLAYPPPPSKCPTKTVNKSWGCGIRP